MYFGLCLPRSQGFSLHSAHQELIPGGRHVCGRFLDFICSYLFHRLVIIMLGLEARQLAVAHGELDLCMTKQLLDGNDIGAAIEQLGRHGMPELMATDMDTTFLRVILGSLLNAPY